MTYQQAIEKVDSRLRFGIKAGLANITELLHRLGDPQKSLRFVHVAGTNGKGTTCTLLASILHQAGYRTGLFTSPYVIDFRERFIINGAMIEEEDVIPLVEAVDPVVAAMERENIYVTEFEYITAMAFLWFQKEQCDIVVLEVGLGGRFDATNVIDVPELAVIASISLDHTAILGDTVEQIAFEKAGIIKPGGTAVVYPDEPEGARRVLEQSCREKGARFVQAAAGDVTVQETTISGTRLLWKGTIPLSMRFIGEHQRLNAANVLAGVSILREKGWNLPDESVQKGFAAARIPARMEVLGEKPLILLDGGHNPGCAAALRQVLETYLPGKKLTAVIGMMADKDSETALSRVVPLFSHVLTLQPRNPRSMTAGALAEVASHYCPDCRAMDSIAEALKLAKELSGEDGAVVVCGSFYLASEVRPYLMEK